MSQRLHNSSRPISTSPEVEQQRFAVSLFTLPGNPAQMIPTRFGSWPYYPSNVFPATAVRPGNLPGTLFNSDTMRVMLLPAVQGEASSTLGISPYPTGESFRLP